MRIAEKPATYRVHLAKPAQSTISMLNKTCTEHLPSNHLTSANPLEKLFSSRADRHEFVQSQELNLHPMCCLHSFVGETARLSMVGVECNRIENWFSLTPGGRGRAARSAVAVKYLKCSVELFDLDVGNAGLGVWA